MRSPESGARVAPSRLTTERDARESVLSRGEGPWTKIIQQNQSARKMMIFVVLPNECEIGERPKLKSAIKRRKKVVLMAWQNIAGAQCCHGSSEPRPRIGQCHSENRG